MPEYSGVAPRPQLNCFWMECSVEHHPSRQTHTDAHIHHLCTDWVLAQDHLLVSFFEWEILFKLSLWTTYMSQLSTASFVNQVHTCPSLALYLNCHNKKGTMAHSVLYTVISSKDICGWTEHPQPTVLLTVLFCYSLETALTVYQKHLSSFVFLSIFVAGTCWKVQQSPYHSVKVCVKHPTACTQDTNSFVTY